MDFYTTSSVAKLFKVTDQTVKNWAREFSGYLSPTATPGDGKRRMFMLEDLKIFALVNDYHGKGFGYEDAHVALRAGQRGEIPDQMLDLAVAAAPPPALMAKLREEIELRDRLIEQVKSERDKERGKVELLEKQLNERDQTIRDLYKQVARLEAKTNPE